MERLNSGLSWGLYPHGLLFGESLARCLRTMCGICGAINLRGEPIPDPRDRLEVVNDLIAHQVARRLGPDLEAALADGAHG